MHLVPKAPRRKTPTTRPKASRRPPKPKAPTRPRRAICWAAAPAPRSSTSSRRSSRRAPSVSSTPASSRSWGSRRRRATSTSPSRATSATTSSASPTRRPAGESFLRDSRDGRVYLMPRGMLADLQNPNHLVDRRLHAFEPGDFDRMVLAAGGKAKEYVQLDREARAKAAFAPAKTPDKRDQMAKNWHDAVWRAFPTEVLGRGEEPAGGKPTVVLRVDYYDGKTGVGYMELGRQEPAGGVSEEAPTGEVYARTEHTAGWLKLHNGAQLLADAQKLLAAPMRTGTRGFLRRSRDEVGRASSPALTRLASDGEYDLGAGARKESAGEKGPRAALRGRRAGGGVRGGARRRGQPGADGPARGVARRRVERHAGRRRPDLPRPRAEARGAERRRQPAPGRGAARQRRRGHAAGSVSHRGLVGAVPERVQGLRRGVRQATSSTSSRG